MDCNFYNQTKTCARCGFSASVLSLRIDCSLPLAVKQAADKIAARHAATQPGVVSEQLPRRSPPSGPGTELHALIGKFGLTASSDCKCTTRAAYLDEMGCDWAEENIDEIVGWLRESAAERGLPFVDIAGRVLVRRAIANARRKEASRAEGSSLHPER